MYVQNKRGHLCWLRFLSLPVKTHFIQWKVKLQKHNFESAKRLIVSDWTPLTAEPRSARLQIASAVRWRTLSPVGLSSNWLHADESADLSSNVCRAVAIRLSRGGGGHGRRPRLEFDELPSHGGGRRATASGAKQPVRRRFHAYCPCGKVKGAQEAVVSCISVPFTLLNNHRGCEILTNKLQFVGFHIKLCLMVLHNFNGNKATGNFEFGRQ